MSIQNKTLILYNNEYKKWAGAWTTISTTEPTAQQFIDHGSDNLSALNRAMKTFPATAMSNVTSTVATDFELSKDAKIFKKAFDLNKYVDLRSVSFKTKR